MTAMRPIFGNPFQGRKTTPAGTRPIPADGTDCAPIKPETTKEQLSDQP